jgi:hypothetical protein
MEPFWECYFPWNTNRIRPIFLKLDFQTAWCVLRNQYCNDFTNFAFAALIFFLDLIRLPTTKRKRNWSAFEPRNQLFNFIGQNFRNHICHYDAFVPTIIVLVFHLILSNFAGVLWLNNKIDFVYWISFYVSNLLLRTCCIGFGIRKTS